MDLVEGLKTKYKRPVAAWWSEFLQGATDYAVKKHTGAKTDEEDRKITYSQIDRLKAQIKSLSLANPDAARTMIEEVAADLRITLPGNEP